MKTTQSNFILPGYIGRFDMMSLLVNIVAATALLRVAVFIVEFFMISILPDRKLYKRAKVHTTEDFSEIRDKRKDSTNSPEEKELQIVSSTRSESPQIQSPPRAQIAAHPSPAPMHSVSVPGQIVMMPPGYHQPQPSGFIPAQQSMYPGQRY